MKILLYVTGSISCYKAYDLTRELTKKGSEVVVVLSSGAERFLRKELFTYLGASKCLGPHDDFSQSDILHIDLARWCDQMVIAPLSANTLGLLSHGQAPDLGTTIFLALESNKPCLVFPAMNSVMLEHPNVINNLSKLKSINSTHVFPTMKGTLACGEIGGGKLLSVENIVTLIQSYPKLKSSLKKRVLISTGASINPLDDVRFITNPASGKTGEELAKKLLSEGHQVTAIFGGTNQNLFKSLCGHPNISLISATTTEDFHSKTMNEFSTCDVFVSSAALSDIEFSFSSGKIKKDQIKESLPISKSVDVLKNVLKQRDRKQLIIGFAAETVLSQELMDQKLKSKPVDILVGTQVNSGISSNSSRQAFGEEEANYKIIQKNKVIFDGHKTKSALADFIHERIEQWFH